MEKLDFKTISETRELDLFLDKIEHHTGVRLPMDYVNRSKVVGVFLHDRIVAGYMLVTAPAFRSLLFVPDKVKAEDPLFANDEFEMMEVNGLWISPSLKTPNLQVRVWAHLIKDIFFARKKYVLVMRNSKNRVMEKLTNMANPTIIYKGRPQLLGGENTHESIEVGFTTRWSIVLNSHRYIKELWRRQRKAAKFAVQRKTEDGLPSAPGELLEA